MDYSLLIPPEMAFYLSPPHECSYLPGREAVTLFADPNAPIDTAVYGALVRLGFRRSGNIVYRPRCPGCAACLSARISAGRFVADRSQRRTWKANQDLEVIVAPADYDEEHYQLYRRYISRRHSGGSMDIADPEQYRNFLLSSWCDTRFVEFRLEGQLLAVSVMDELPQGLSAVYTFFDPDQPRRGLGVFAVLWLIAEAQRRGLPWVFLGYLIRECPKMAYKERYRPLEVFADGAWRPLDSLPPV